MSAIIFDLDGTLIDTEETWDVVRRQLAADAGLSWPDEATQAMMGMSTQEWSTYLVEGVGLPVTPREAADLTIKAMAEHHRRGVAVLPGAVESVRRMAAEHQVAIASSSPRVLIDAAVEALGIADVIEVSVSTEEVERGKPAPDGYLRACELLGVDPARAIAVEDAPNGVKSALAAGLQVVVVPPHFHPPSADLLAHTTVLDSLNELTASLVAGLLA